ncbi:conserved membrane hypothetical protein [Tenacibaculum sediminilitoris]|uniref:hypothetical protein n=1 Tax=Tenacibaculum sediminilitoris TaxID=1820334 RepID=UPI003892DB5B
MIKKIKIKLILLELIALVFVVNGLQRIYIAAQGVKYDALAAGNLKKLELLIQPESIGQFIANRVFWTFGIILCLIFIVGLINWKNQIEIMNSIILLILVLGISCTGFFFDGFVNQYLNYFCGLFSESYEVAFGIGGVILFIIGVGFFLKAMSLNKNFLTIKNEVL